MRRDSWKKIIFSRQTETKKDFLKEEALQYRDDRGRTCDILVPNQARYHLRYIPFLWAVRDSNSRQPGCKPGALPTELTARISLGREGLEPPNPIGSGFTVRRNCHYAISPKLPVGLGPTTPRLQITCSTN